MSAPGLTAAGADRDSRAERLERARGALNQVTARVQDRAETSRHTSALADAGTLPVTAELAPLFLASALRRGSTVAVGGSLSLLLALLAEASAGGHWSAIVGLPDLGMVAVAEAGLDLARTAVVPHPEGQLVGVLAALLDGIELVAVAGAQRLRAGDRQRLAARARECGAVLLAYGGWTGADVELRVAEARWAGATADGQGRLRARNVRVAASGRGNAHRIRSVWVQLPGPSGWLTACAGRDVRQPASWGRGARRAG